jgi:hypothetical protein
VILRRSTRAAAALLAAVLLVPAAAHADSKDTARSHFERGVELYREGDFRSALIEFQRAYEASPNYKVLYNLGQTSLELQDYAGALKALRGYLQGGGRAVPPARRTQVQADLKRLESRVAHVDIRVNVTDAEVTVDDVSVGKSPLHGPVLVSEGRRRIAATKAGLTSAERVIDVAGGDSPKVSLELVEPKAPAPVIVPVPTPEPRETPAPVPVAPTAPLRTTSSPSTGFWIGLTATGALAVGTAVLGGLALASKSTFDSRLAQVGVQTSSVDSARNQTRAFALATDITGGVAIAAAVTTVVLALTTSNKHVVREHEAHLVVGPTFVGLAGEL